MRPSGNSSRPQADGVPTEHPRGGKFASLPCDAASFNRKFTYIRRFRPKPGMSMGEIADTVALTLTLTFT